MLLGGYGVTPGVRAGDRMDLPLTRQQVWLTKYRHPLLFLRVDWEETRAFTFEGGAVRNGDGVVGGGSGFSAPPKES